MKKLFILLTITLSLAQMALANEIDTLWYRTMGAGAQDVDFTPDDKFVVAWANGIEFWEVQQGVKEFYIPSEATGDFNYNEEYLVFAQDSTPKLLNWQTREVVEGFEKMPYKIDRIKTAKSKNEFMSKLSQDSNIIYFWDIESKQVSDKMVFDHKFKKGNYEWRRTVHKYDYVGNNDELIYAIIYDENDVYQNIHPSERRKHFFVHFYNRETKELVDSVYSFTNTNEQFGGYNKMQVMNDRTKIAWNHKSGEIYIYNITNKSFNKKYSRNDFSKVNDIEFSNDNQLMYLSYGEVINVFQLETGDLHSSFNTGSTYGQCNLSRNKQFMVGSVGGYIIMHSTTITNIETNENQNKLLISPNPSNSYLNIELNINSVDYIKISLIDLAGNIKEIIHEGLTENSFSKQLDISHYSAGVYFVQLEINNEVFTKQFIKE